MVNGAVGRIYQNNAIGHCLAMVCFQWTDDASKQQLWMVGLTDFIRGMTA